MARKRRTKRAYQELFDDPTRLFEGCEVILYPNGEPEIWIKSTEHRHGIVITAGRGPAGMGLHLRRVVGSPPMTTGGNLEDGTVYPPKGERQPDYSMLEVTQMDSTPYAQAHRAWYEGRGEYPGTREEFEAAN